MQNTGEKYRGNLLRLSKAIASACEQYQVPCRVYTAVLATESMYKLGAVNSRTSDLGIAQINPETARSLGLDQKRLTTDLEYSVNAGAQVLAWFYKTYRTEEPRTWVARYNCGTKPSCIYWPSVQKYVSKLQKYGARL
jgi:soluble lytic murein transglycosylase-like protein